MVLNTISVGAAVTPTVISTYFSHYLNRAPLRQKPTAHISYHEGLQLVRQFLRHASYHTVEEVQAFTRQWVPAPAWVKTEAVDIDAAYLSRAAALLQEQLGTRGVELVGGAKWWQWRGEGETARLRAEWIEMRKDYNVRKERLSPTASAPAALEGIVTDAGPVPPRNPDGADRIMLYVHGGAYYFGSVDEHRYQMQRHARKLQARVLAPRYRLAPQFPFPCGLHDCLAAYLFLLGTKHDPSTILLAGDSAGAGMVLALLVTLRDRGLPLPAGAILISPWVDLTHSFPSLNGDGKLDYIPPNGFVHKPSMAWPPPNADELETISKGDAPKTTQKRKRGISLASKGKKEPAEGFSVHSSGSAREEPRLSADPAASGATTAPSRLEAANALPDPLAPLTISLDGTRISIKDQIQLYAPNHLLSHPLVSPILQPSLGGLPPLLIQVGGGELLRDEQLYLAHKCAAPTRYAPSAAHLAQWTEGGEAAGHAHVARWKGTDVQVQLWDDLCHVAPTLSWTRPAKYMYRSVAQFGAWALARAQRTGIEILDDESVSVISESSSASSSTSYTSESSAEREREAKRDKQDKKEKKGPPGQSPYHTRQHPASVGKAGEALPPFEAHMIRHRVDRHGRIYPLLAPSELVACTLAPEEIGVVKEGPVHKWMDTQQKWNRKFRDERRRAQHRRLEELEGLQELLRARKGSGWDGLEVGADGLTGERPPPTALVGRKRVSRKERRDKKSWGMSLWSGWGSKHDEMTIERERAAESLPIPSTSTTALDNAAAARPSSSATRPKRGRSAVAASKKSKSRSRPRAFSMPSSRSVSKAKSPRPRSLSAREGVARPDGEAPGAAAPRPPEPARNRSWMRSVTDEGQTGERDAKGKSETAALPATRVPPTRTASARPETGGVAYPFKLAVPGAREEEMNASTMTLASVGMEDGKSENGAGTGRDGKEEGGAGAEKGGEEKSASRPAVERFVTASEGL
ncbi:hypothetical protein BDY21DRAFT_309862 [Lineolata rhizophorae]|uniref:Alpha/beta hydrolase fold-3 domain-containing protein n=1 Tax=Lineolata rhizophorae TaxID=578093 RepID=A0A6A6NPP9_9PEZI|nr:hypothetical protein BDY21DRAFT_309862 [Lineolata rhizophorae]